jgi:hypothetical protein
VPSSSSSSSAAATTTISVADAEAIALRAAGGGRVTKVERETEHGRPVYDVEVWRGSTEHDIDVDRTTGAVLRHAVCRDDDRGGSGSGSGPYSPDDRGGDDHGSGGHGSDDRGGDDHGSGGHGSDD